MEVKSVTLAETKSEGGELRAVFPDCISERATRHALCLTELQRKQEDLQTFIFFLIQRDDCTSFSASCYDEVYRNALSVAHKSGVNILP